MTEVGDGSWCYSSSSRAAADFGAGYFGFREHEVDPLWRKSGSRAYGLSVRCVQHLPTAFSPFLRVAAGGEPGFFGRPDCATARKPV
ncbi:hypothetical protein [uncultured Alistipes sp.]|uniref:hypothetical protein n=1 Tax=uncultured Alistipes sp. TaxID=538949 RepID=UPI0025A5DE7C|nr:hypothetical protein [uncultured Alistipes sp.]